MPGDQLGEGTADDVVGVGTFVGRADELLLLQDLADAAVEQGCQMVLLSGEAGIGKSTLTRAFQQTLRDAGWGVHVGHCIDFAERAMPFGPVVNILRSVLLDDLDHADDLVGPNRADIGALLPEFGDEAESRSLAGDMDRLFDSVSSVLRRAAQRRPIVIAVEDIHWADAATRDLMSWLIHALADSRVLIIVTERTDGADASHPVHEWLAEMRRYPNVRSVELAGLSPDELAKHAAVVLGEDADADYLDDLRTRTDGNPFFATELLTARAAGGDDLPTTLVSFLTRRLRDRTADERSVLQAMAVFNGPIDHGSLVTMLPAVDVGPAVRSLFDASMLVIDGQAYTFRHALLSDAIEAELLPFEAQDLHRRAAELIEERAGERLELADAVSLVGHWAECGAARRSAVGAWVAAKKAAAVGAFDTAADMALQVIDAEVEIDEHQSFADIYVLAADWLSWSQRTEEARDVLRRGIDAAVPRSDAQARMLSRVGVTEYYAGSPESAEVMVSDAEAMVGSSASADAAEVHSSRIRLSMLQARLEPALAAAERAMAIAETTGQEEVLVAAMSARALVIGLTEGTEPGIREVLLARRRALDAGMTGQVAHSYRVELNIRNQVDGRTVISTDSMAEGLDYTHRFCGPRWRAESRAEMALSLLEGGRFLVAQEHVDALRDVKVHNEHFRVTVENCFATWALGHGDIEAAERHIEAGRTAAEMYSGSQERGWHAQLAAETARRSGRLDQAIGLIKEAIDLQRNSDNATFFRETIAEAARVTRTAMAVGHDDGDELASWIRGQIADFSDPHPASEAKRLFATIEVEAGKGALERSRVEQALVIGEETGFWYDVAQILLLFAEQEVRAGANDGAEAIHALWGYVERTGSTWIIDRARTLAQVARVEIESSANDGDDGVEPELPHFLTEREVEVMSLLAEGLSNKAIGERLFVSPRTVSTHISNLLAKLGVSNRGEAAAAYHNLGLSEIIDLREPRPA